MKSVDLQRKWALAGATVRLQEAQAEIAEIYRIFPELRRGAGGAGTTRVAPQTGRKRKFSKKGKAAISEGMRKYWARRKAQAAKAKG